MACWMRLGIIHQFRWNVITRKLYIELIYQFPWLNIIKSDKLRNLCYISVKLRLHAQKKTVINFIDTTERHICFIINYCRSPRNTHILIQKLCKINDLCAWMQNPSSYNITTISICIKCFPNKINGTIFEIPYTQFKYSSASYSAPINNMRYTWQNNRAVWWTNVIVCHYRNATK